MRGVLSYLSRKRWLALVILLIYFISVVLPHNEVGRWINGFFDIYSRSTYNAIIAIVFGIIGLSFLFFTYKQIPLVISRRIASIYGFITVSLLLLCFNVLMVINIEAVHFVQYALLAFLLFAITRNYQDVMVWAIFFGALDEAYQYLYLENNAFYYDFNDIVLDAVGAGIGVFILRICDIRSDIKKNRPWYAKPSAYLPIIISVFLAILSITGYFSVNANVSSPAFFTLFQRQSPSGFWYYPMGPYARFHILEPIPAIVIIAGIVYTYGLLEKK